MPASKPTAAARAEIAHPITGVNSAAERSRIAAIDFVKAAAILAVVPVHAGYSFWDPRFTPLEFWVRVKLMSFNVPSFLWASGFLYYSAQPLLLAEIRHRLFRILAPYLVASLFLQVTGLALVGGVRDALYQLITASAADIYYFIFLLVAYILFTWPLSRLSPRGQILVLIALCAYGALTSVRPQLAPIESWSWAMRNPVHYAGYFVAGWLVRAHWTAVRTAVSRYRVELLAVSLTGIATYVTAYAGGDVDGRVVAVLRAIYTASVVGVIVILSGDRVPPRAVRALSEATYTVYLYHSFIAAALLPFTATWGAGTRTVALSTAAVLGSMAIVRAGRALLGGRARYVIGA